MKPRYLTKSRFVSAIDCPTKLFYLGKKEYRNINNEDSFLASLAQGGYQVGALAKFLFKDGIEIVDKSHEASIKITEELLKKDDVVIYEAAIKFKNFFYHFLDLFFCRLTISSGRHLDLQGGVFGDWHIILRGNE